ncbi:hypothetical protein [Phytopseudomonas dryadis]|uniref:Lysozyme n=1 Tax=Phytopseudomonas dryadis TaxID=2487520 RepID=A0A4Q9QU37_9GAMM|nr:hypothetical protein [Pseudomonas dryadis]TBU86796.1 hypothetical protein DNK44_22105 [Pseudomonas dryadis]
MILNDIRAHAITPALSLLPARMSSASAEIMLLAITQQEDPDQRRRQWPTGPARGLWQFERGGGVRGVLNHAASSAHAWAVCAARGVEPDPAAVWAALEHDDVLAAAFARLLLWTDPKPLPGANDPAGGWSLYERTWRPGRPHPERWAGRYAAAVREVSA